MGDDRMPGSNDSSSRINFTFYSICAILPLMQIFQNIRLLFARRSYLIAYILMVLVLLGTWYFFTNHKIIVGNYGLLHASIDIGLSMIVIWGFPLFLLAWIFRSITLGSSNKKHASAGLLGGIMGVIISGSSCCGLTLATYFGLIPLMSFLPWSGLEIKIIAVCMLAYSLYTTLKNLTTCAYKPKKR